MHSATALKAES